MADRWLGLCSEQARESTIRALHTVDAASHITFMGSPSELRRQTHEARACVGVIVGPLDDGYSSLNVAATIVRDDVAASVVLAVLELTDEVSERARRAGLSTVVDLSTLPPEDVADLDEALVQADDIPTMIMGSWKATARIGALVPPLDAKDTASPDVDGQHALVVSESKMGSTPDSFGTRLLNAGEDVSMELVVDQDSADDHTLLFDVGPSFPRGDGGQEMSAVPTVRVQRTPGQAPIITFVSGRGGTGKTALVAAMACAADTWGMRVALCDLDLTCGNLYSCFGLVGPVDVADLASNAQVEQQLLLALGSKVCSRSALWGPCERPELAEAIMPHVGHLLTSLANTHDVVLVDTSSCLTDAVAQAAQLCDRLVIVVDDRPGSAVAQTRWGALAVRLGVARTRVVRLANRCGTRGRGEPILNHADVGLETARSLRVLDGGSEVADCLAEGKVSDLFEVGSRFAQSASTATAVLLSELGRLPDHVDARAALQRRSERNRWAFGRKREAM